MLGLHISERHHILCTDTSEVPIGRVLPTMQLWGQEGQLVECLLGYFSRKLNDIETHNAMSKSEMLAMHNSSIHWKTNLSDGHTSLYPDHASL